MTLAPPIGVDYHVNYRGPTYLSDVWYLCGAFDNPDEAKACFATRLASDMAGDAAVGSEWRLVSVRDAEIVEVIEHVRLTAKGSGGANPTVLEDLRRRA